MVPLATKYLKAYVRKGFPELVIPSWDLIKLSGCILIFSFKSSKLKPSSSFNFSVFSSCICTMNVEIKLESYGKLRFVNVLQGVSSVRCGVLVSSLHTSAKKFKRTWLEQVGFDCPHHRWMSPSLNLHLRNNKIPFKSPDHPSTVWGKKQKTSSSVTLKNHGCISIRVSSNRNGQKNRKIGIRTPKK